MKKTVLTYGSISGVIMAIALVIMGALLSGKDANYDNSMFVGYAFMILGFIIIYPAMVSYRDNVGNGHISFGRALSVGLLIIAIACVCYSLTWMVVCHTMMPDFMDNYAAHIIEKARKSGASPESINAQIAEMKKWQELYKNPVVMFFITFCEPLPVGIPLSLICAAVIKKKKAKIVMG